MRSIMMRSTIYVMCLLLLVNNCIKVEAGFLDDLLEDVLEEKYPVTKEEKSGENFFDIFLDQMNE